MAKQHPMSTYVSTKGLSQIKRASIPVSQMLSERDEVLVISRYSDSVWDLSPYIQTKNTPQNRKRINFAVKLGNGTCLTDSDHSELLDSVKTFIYARWRVKSVRGKYLSASSVVSDFKCLRLLLNWMVLNGIHYFSELTPEKCQAYVEFSKMESVPQGRNQGKKLQPATLMRRFLILEFLYQLKDHLEDTLSEHPWQHTSAAMLAGIVRSGGHSDQRMTESIPKELAKHLMQQALDYVENQAEKLLNARDEILRMEEEIYQQAQRDYFQKSQQPSLEIFYKKRKKDAKVNGQVCAKSNLFFVARYFRFYLKKL